MTVLRNPIEKYTGPSSIYWIVVNDIAQMRRLGVFILALLLVYGGVASALEKCLIHTLHPGNDHEPHIESLALEHLSSHPVTHRSPDSTIECHHSYNRVTLTLPTRGRPQLPLLEKISFLRMSPAHQPGNLDLLDVKLRRTFIFEGRSAFPHHGGLLRYLFFSVFLI